MSTWRSIGFWTAAVAVVATAGAARIPDGRTVTQVASASVLAATPTTTPPKQPSGSVEAVVPVASFGPGDGAPQLLVAGRTYPMVVTVWVAATSGPAVIDVSTSSGRLVGCAQRAVPAGVYRLKCGLLVASNATDKVSIGVIARTHDHGVVVGSYSHQIA